MTIFKRRKQHIPMAVRVIRPDNHDLSPVRVIRRGAK